MPATNTVAFGGLQPLIDRRRVSAPYIVDGKNFLVDLEGPKSGFARTLLINEGLTTPIFVQSFRISEELGSFIFTDGVILQYNQIKNQLIPVLIFTQPAEDAPWFHAEVGGLQYFVRRGLNLIQYNPNTDVWQEITGVSVPVNLRSCTQSAGRLILLAIGIVAWSAIDDGSDFVPSTVTGAGFQSLSIIGATGDEDAFSVFEYSNGFLTYTSKGVLRSESIQTVSVFRHRILSRNLEHRPLDAFVTIQFGEYKQLFLSEAGFYTTEGDLPELWEPLMSEYFHDKVLPTVDLNKQAIFRLTYDATRKWLFVSISENEQAGVYNKAFVYYTPSEQWGVFNRTHVGFVDIPLANGPDVGFDFSYVTSDGSIFKFTGGPQDEVFPDAGNIFIYDFHAPIEYPARQELTNNKMPTVMRLTTQDESEFETAGVYDTRKIIQEVISPEVYQAIEINSLNGSSGFWVQVFGGFWIDVVDDLYTQAIPSIAHMRTVGKMAAGLIQTTTALADTNYKPLDSWILIGPYRFSTNADIDELSFISGLSVGMLGSAVGDTIIDWMNDYEEDVITDWMLMAEQVTDWGGASSDSNEFDLEVWGTLDAYSVWEQMRAVPVLVTEFHRHRQYSCYVTGLYNLIRVSAEASHKNYHLKTLELEVYPAGRLF